LKRIDKLTGQKTKRKEVNMNAKIKLRLGKVWPVTKQPLNAQKPHEVKGINLSLCWTESQVKILDNTSF
jgi:hypothetical protein